MSRLYAVPLVLVLWAVLIPIAGEAIAPVGLAATLVACVVQVRSLHRRYRRREHR
jgi:hypothetical protein